MVKRLIVTADDLGLTAGINKGIVDACKDGVVTAVSIIPTGDAIREALDVVKDLPFKDVGAHLSLSETRPILPDSKYYRNHIELFIDMLLRRIDENDIYSELTAQLELLKDAGLKISHINSHEHVHMMPKILDIFIRLAKEYNIPAIRFPRGDRPVRGFEPEGYYRKFILDRFTRPMKNRLVASGLAYTDYFFGFMDAGRVNRERIKNILKLTKEGVTELVVHPGFLSPELLEEYSWHRGAEVELFALTDRSVRTAVEENGIRLIGFDEFWCGRRELNS